MPRLVLINGAPSSGKSTMARRYAQDRPLTLALDVDTVRAMLGGWLDQMNESGLAARHLALAMARAHLLQGHDVVVPQYLGRLPFVLQLEDVAGQVGARFVEIALVSDPGDAAARFARRSASPETDGHRDAAAVQERSGGAAAFPEMYERLLEVIRARPGTRRIPTVEGEVEQTYRLVLEAIGEG